MNASPAKLIASSEFTELLYLPGDSDQLLVTFASMSERANGLNFWAEPAVRKLGLSCLGFVARFPHWYPFRDTSALILQAGEILSRYRSRVTYGSSMGGYAAIKFSRQLGTQHALAFSPQWSIGPESWSYDSSYKKNFDPANNEGMAVNPMDCAGNVFIFYDNLYRSDRGHAERIANVYKACLVPVPGTQHATIQCMAGSEKLTALLNLTEQLDCLGLYRFFRAQRRGVGLFRDQILLHRAKLLVEQQRFGEAVKPLRKFLSEKSDEPAYFLLGRCLLQLRDYTAAEEAYRKCVALNPGSPWPYRQLSWALLGAGRNSEAIASAERAIALAPADPLHVEHLSTILARERSG